MKVYGKIEYGWLGCVILPLDQATKFVELLALGLHREVGNHPDKGVTQWNDDGQPLSVPSVEILTDVDMQRRKRIGIEHHEALRAKRAAEQGTVAYEEL